MIRSMKTCGENMASSNNFSSMTSWLSSNSDEDPLPDVSFLTNCSLLDFLKTKLEPDEEMKPQVSSTYKSPIIVKIEVSSPEQSSDISDLHSDEITIEKVPDDCDDEQLFSEDEEKPNAHGSEVALNIGKSVIKEIVPQTLKEVKCEPHFMAEDAKHQNNRCYPVKEMLDDKFVPVEVKKEPSSSSFECEICHKTYSKLSYLVCHIRIHSRPKPFKCDICNREFPWLSRMVNHKKKVHSGEKPFKCKVCNQSFNDKYNMTRHEGNHSKQLQQWRCDLCEESFSVRSDWMEHKRNNHIKIHTCELCGRVYSKKSNLMNHIKMAHDSSDINKCALCDESFDNVFSLHEHKSMRHNSSDINKCILCNETFDDAFSLHEHKKMRHVNEGKYRCQVCKRGFPNLWSLNKHRVARHLVGFAYGCDKCDMTFYEQGHLMNHSRCHFPRSLSE